LGRSSLRQAQQTQKQSVQHEISAQLLNEFKQNTQSRFSFKRSLADLRRCKSTCESLDRANGIEDNPLWYKPPKPVSESKQGEAETETETETETEAAEGYRIPSSSLSSSSSSYPIELTAKETTGPAAQEAEEQEAKEEEAEEEEEERLDVESVLSRLDGLLQYMRAVHRYCFYCAIQFRDEADMRHHCPGPYQVDHDDDEGSATSLSGDNFFEDD